MIARIYCSALLAALLPAAAHAQQAPAPDAAGDADASGIIVTAMRTPTPIDRVAASITVLDKARIDLNQDIGVTEQLLRTPGVSVSRNGGYGTQTSLRIRGAEPDQTVVVIDGVKLNDPSNTDGSYNFANLLVGDIARIEILRGPQSTLWGSQAIGGVINIVTATPERPLEGSLDLEAGSRDTVNARAAVGGKAGPLTWRVAGTEFTTNGISAIAPAFGGVEKDGYSNQTVTGRAELKLAENVSVDVRGYYSGGRTDFDAFAGDDLEYGLNREYLGYGGLNVALLGGRFRNRIAFAYTGTDRDNYNPQNQRQLTFDAAGHNQRIEYQGSFAIARGWDATFGVDHEKSDFRSVSPPASLATPVPAPARGSTELTGVYGQINGTIVEGLTLTGGIRRDHHSTYGGQTLFSAGGVWNLRTGTTLRASYGEGFKAPSLYQLFSEYGNQGLQPARAHGWEAGAGQKLLDGKIDLGATYFRRRTNSQIIFNSCPFPPNGVDPLCVQPGTTTPRFGYYLNVSKTEAHGVELTGTLHPVESLTIDGNYSWIVAEDRSPGATYGLWLPRRPRREANGAADYRWPCGLSTGIAVRWSGRSYDDTANRTPLHGYTLIDLRAELPVTKAVSLFGRIENLADESYMTAYRYGSLGRSVYFGVRGRF
jgi:vitamin B12 transporter